MLALFLLNFIICYLLGIRDASSPMLEAVDVQFVAQNFNVSYLWSVGRKGNYSIDQSLSILERSLADQGTPPPFAWGL
jgi:hypothetical protein